MGGNNEFFENFERSKYLKKLPSMQRFNIGFTICYCQADAVKSENVPMEILRRSIDLAESREEKMELEQKLSDLLAVSKSCKRYVKEK